MPPFDYDIPTGPNWPGPGFWDMPANSALAEYERLVSQGERPEIVGGRYWNDRIPGPERAQIARRYFKGNPYDPDDEGPRWLNCPCSKEGGAISYRWGHSPYCERCGALL